MQKQTQPGPLAAGRTLWDYQVAAEHLNHTRRTIEEWVARGRIPYLKIGRSVRFDPAALDEWLASECAVEAEGRA